MKKYLVASAVAIVVFAVTAMAASLSVGSSILAVGEGDVTSCSDDVALVTYSFDGQEPEWTGSTWIVNQADVVLDETCRGLAISFALEGITGSTTTVVSEMGTATFAFDDTDPELITRHSIVVRD
jgi:hypothetical protein